MNSIQVIVYRTAVLVLLVYIAIQLYVLKVDLKDNFNEIDMVISKLDYLESDINTRK